MAQRIIAAAFDAPLVFANAKAGVAPNATEFRCYMNNRFFGVGMALSCIAGGAFLAVVVLKVSDGRLFERYRTTWLFELDYFSVLVILFFVVIVVPLVTFAFKLKGKRDREKLRRYVERNKRKIGG